MGLDALFRAFDFDDAHRAGSDIGWRMDDVPGLRNDRETLLALAGRRAWRAAQSGRVNGQTSSMPHGQP
jgi:hypothetical protein